MVKFCCFIFEVKLRQQALLRDKLFKKDEVVYVSYLFQIMNHKIYVIEKYIQNENDQNLYMIVIRMKLRIQFVFLYNQAIVDFKSNKDHKPGIQCKQMIYFPFIFTPISYMALRKQISKMP